LGVKEFYHELEDPYSVDHMKKDMEISQLNCSKEQGEEMMQEFIRSIFTDHQMHLDKAALIKARPVWPSHHKSGTCEVCRPACVGCSSHSSQSSSLPT
jgi:hypothetical protein